MKLCFVVDYYKRAWDITSQDALKFGDFEGTVIDISALRNQPNLNGYDHILVYPWNDEEVRKLLQQYKDKIIVCIASGDQEHARIIDEFEKCCKPYRYIGANTPHILNTYSMRFPNKTVFLLSHGVDTKLFQPKEQDKNKFTIGWVGRPSYPIKRYDTAKEIVNSIPGTEMKIAGFYGEFDYDYYEHEEMPRFYNGLDCLIVTSEFESHPLCVYEAMSCGLPVITTNVGDILGTIINGVNGFVISDDKLVQNFAIKIKMLMDRPDYRKRMGLFARQTILQNWRWESIINQYNNISLLK